jgi:hypothetical protein
MVGAIIMFFLIMKWRPKWREELLRERRAFNMDFDETLVDKAAPLKKNPNFEDGV